MIVCKLVGGLGNQMFQYAYATELAKKMNDEICFDVDFYRDSLPAIFNLQITQKQTTDQVTLADLGVAKKMEKAYHVLQYLIRKLNHERIGAGLFHFLSQFGYYFNFDPFYYSPKICNKKNKYIYGYYQGIEYFQSSEHEIKQQFVGMLGDTARIYENKIKECNAVAVHIRLGDYREKKNQYLNVCTDAYYSRGINYIKEHVDNSHFFVFTNDANLVRQKGYIPRDAIIIEKTKDYEDLMLMKACKHFVISGSTFSWWGSYLSENEMKITIAPKVWMNTLLDEPAITKRSDLVRLETE